MLKTQDLDLSRVIRPGDRLMWGQSVAEPRSLIAKVIEQRARFGGIRVFLGIGSGGQLGPEHADSIGLLSYCGSGTNRRLAKAGVLDILPAHYSQLPKLIRGGGLRTDVLMLQVSPPDVHGRYSLGQAREYLVAAVSTARVIIGEVHPDVPWTFGGPYLTAGDFALLVESESDLPDLPAAEIGPIEQAIGRNVASLVTDGATLQTGIGAIPDAVLGQLAGHRELGLHSGSIGNGALRLIEAGVITNTRKSVDRGISIGGIIIGGAALRRFAHCNPVLQLHGTDYTHGRDGLRRIEGLVAINSALEVDLTGQVNSETAGTYVGGVGGINDFLRAAGASPRGLPIVALPSMAGTLGRIVPRLNGPVTVARSDPCIIVTEYGIADLRGASLAERAARMIAIAHPDQRETLARAVREKDLVS
ncbi:acetyl-CoA hydrolase/transferase family protein [Sphingomonas sp. CL5.1]|uniref:acetyl-CoA hydrolase/transferase family protein n=1 Tax=Sphingomonas sp. CL5.1 TaxID=2653203 RepID=UPI00158319FD|nr:acetyl-CoA hydrolase/transferase family protein [Sphingomonas sp. CL5.1]QKS01972.1 acetyl-CoA hydrolase/transferase family protein [Sphingomonas sp. CL5.1]